MRSNWYIVKPALLLVALVAVAAACWDTGATTTTTLAVAPETTAAPSTTTTTTTEAPVESTTTSTAAPSTTSTTAANDEIPIPDTAGDDWQVIVQELVDFIEWLEANAAPGLVEVVSMPDSQHAGAFAERMAEYVDNGWFQGTDEATTVVDAALVLQATEVNVIVDAVLDESATTLFG